jgi:hypothetical protein
MPEPLGLLRVTDAFEAFAQGAQRIAQEGGVIQALGEVEGFHPESQPVVEIAQ